VYTAYFSSFVQRARVLMMRTPGAARSTVCVPKFEKVGRSSYQSEAMTTSVLSRQRSA
jgi:hypothetical protein